MGENENIENLLSDEGVLDDQLSTERDEMIESLITKAVDRVHKIAPLQMVRDAAYPQYSPFESNDEYCKKMSMPAEFLRLVSVKLWNWRKAVSGAEVITPEAEEYVQLRSPIKAMRTTERDPFVVLTNDSEYEFSIEAYPKPEKEDEEKQDVVSMIIKSIIADDVVNVSVPCYNAVLYMIAYLYYLSISDTEKAAAMQKEVEGILEIKDNNSQNR